MRRVLLLAALGLLLHSLEAGIAVVLGVTSLPIAPAVVLVAYAALVEPPLEAALAASSLGLVLDALSGSALGLNMLACLLVLLLGRLAASRVPSPRGASGFLFAVALSAVYYLLVLTLLYVFEPGRQSFGIRGLVTTSLANGALSVALFPAVQRTFVALGLEEREQSMEERLRRRTR